MKNTIDFQITALAQIAAHYLITAQGLGPFCTANTLQITAQYFINAQGPNGFCITTARATIWYFTVYSYHIRYLVINPL